MDARAPGGALATIAIGHAAFLVSFGYVLLLVPAWITIAFGLALLARQRAWRRGALAGLSLHVAFVVLTLIAAGTSVGFQGRPIAAFGGIPLRDDAFLVTLGFLGAPFGATLALALAPLDAGWRLVARVGVGLGVGGMLVGVIAMFDPGFTGLIGIPAILLPLLAVIAFGWAWRAQARIAHTA